MQRYARTRSRQGGVEPAGQVYETHTHARAQLFHIFSGSLRLETAVGCFVVPPERALWIPSNVPHAVTYLQRSSLRYLFLRPDAVKNLSEKPTVITVTPLLRELVQAFLEIPRSEAASAPAERIILVLSGSTSHKPSHTSIPTHAECDSTWRSRPANPG